eukprot:g1508.t1
MRDFFRQHGVPQSLPISEKYHTDQAAAYRRRIKALVENKPVQDESVPRWEAKKNGSRAAHVGSNAGGSGSDYVNMSRSKQMSMEALARERMRKKFGKGKLGGVGSGGVVRGGQSNREDRSNSSEWGRIQETLGSALKVATQKTAAIQSRIAERDWNGDVNRVRSSIRGAISDTNREKVASTITDGFSWLSLGASSLWSKASESIRQASSESDEPIRLYRRDGVNRSPPNGRMRRGDDTTLGSAFARERRRSRSFSPPKRGTKSYAKDGRGDSTPRNTAPSRSDFDPFGLEEDFLGEIDAVLNDHDVDASDNGHHLTNRTKAPPPPSNTTTAHTKKSTAKPRKKAEKKKTSVSGDDFFSSFGV